MSATSIGVVLGIAVRPARNAPMRELTEATAIENSGLREDLTASPDRGITLIATGQWREVVSELGADLPWHTRRANILIDRARLGDLIGRTIQIGVVRMKIIGETRPCELMDELYQGLRAALTPDVRAGVHGRVLSGGAVRIGDAVEIVE